MSCTYSCKGVESGFRSLESYHLKRGRGSESLSRKLQGSPEMTKNNQPSNLIDFADQLAQELVEYAEANGLSARELIMGLVLTERLLQQVFPGERFDHYWLSCRGVIAFN